MLPNQASPTDDATAEGEGSPESAPTQGYEIRICVYADGSLAVKRAPLEDKSDAPPDQEQSQRFDNPKEAFAEAARIYAQNPVGQDENAAYEQGMNSVMRRGQPGSESEYA